MTCSSVWSGHPHLANTSCIPTSMTTPVIELGSKLFATPPMHQFAGAAQRPPGQDSSAMVRSIDSWAQVISSVPSAA